MKRNPRKKPRIYLGGRFVILDHAPTQKSATKKSGGTGNEKQA